ncbi:hypothetical protein H696_01652 [Fonticula alba]|uniref:ribose-phosphate diphosphokinase n=1 Tax=Fonticula alba TaxID=691883 RepID=A0A058ZEA4_FONAL|nr:hypothetical protein H696_01652 [Fonticula alba]KCV72253.1 hypothetical protein H696_01652 [Fonticula alba]|eukprot:XP_009493831.1 hypothetical protein H696_01652 [Fonticula alba]
MRALAILSGRSHPLLAESIADRLGVSVGEVRLMKFANRETSVEIKQDVRGKDVFIIQSGGVGNVNDHLIDMLIIIHACKIASARRIVAVIPFFPYSRQADIPYSTASPVVSAITAPMCGSMVGGRAIPPGEMAPTSRRVREQWQARPGTLVANMLTAAGVDHIITMDLHDAQFQGFFDIPVDNLLAQPLMLRYIRQCIPDYENAVIVSPDSGGAKRAIVIAERLGLDFGLVHKERRAPGSPVNDTTFVGDVNGRPAIIIDDIVDTGTTLLQAATVLRRQGATRVVALVTHAVLAGDTAALIGSSTHLDELIVSTSVPLPKEKIEASRNKIRQFDVAYIFAEAIRRIHNGESVSYLFEEHWR